MFDAGYRVNNRKKSLKKKRNKDLSFMTRPRPNNKKSPKPKIKTEHPSDCAECTLGDLASCGLIVPSCSKTKKVKIVNY